MLYFRRKYENLEKLRDKLKEAYNVASNKDVQLQADMVQTNNNRKKTKKLLEEEKKKLDDLEKVPEKNEKVNKPSHLTRNITIIVFFIDH